MNVESPPPHSHSAGDVLMIQPQNNKAAVDELLTLLGLDPDQLFTLTQNDPGELSLCRSIYYCVCFRPILVLVNYFCGCLISYGPCGYVDIFRPWTMVAEIGKFFYLPI